MSTLFDEPKPAPAMIRLRPYQVEALEAIAKGEDEEGLTSQLLVLATGLGKTTVFSEQIARDRAKNPRSKILVLAHREELLDQAARRIALQNPGLRVDIEAGPRRANPLSDVVVAGVATIGRENTSRLGWFIPDRIITDEAHHSCANSYMVVYRRYGVFTGGAKHLGVTATAHRLDNKPLHGTEKAIFEKVALNYGLKEGIRDGWLADLKGFRVGVDLHLDKIKKVGGDFAVGELSAAVNTTEHNEFAFQQWQEVAADRKTIVFCVDVNHAVAVAETFRAHGVAAEHVDGTMDADQRERVMSGYREGRIHVLVNVQIATEGFDDPDTRCVLMLRPTQSWALFVQMIGRGTRTLPGVIDGIDTPEARKAAIAASGKPDCIILDVVDLTSKHSAVTLPAAVGMPGDLDLEGKGLDEALELVESLGEGGRGWLFGKARRLSDIPKKLTEIDLLAELDTPADIRELTKFQWIQIGEDAYTLGCGSDANEKRREAKLVCDTLGEWKLTLSSDTRSETYPLGSDRTAAFALADGGIRRKFPGASFVASSDAPWRNEKPTDKQIALLKRNRVSQEQIDIMNRGEASALLTKLLGNKGPRR